MHCETSAHEHIAREPVPDTRACKFDSSGASAIKSKMQAIGRTGECERSAYPHRRPVMHGHFSPHA